MRLLVLAGGRGSRLGSITDDVPKFLAPVSDTKRFADYQLAWIKERGFTDVILSIGYRGQQIRDYCGDGSRWGLQLSYSEDGDEPLGTGGATRKALLDKPGRSAIMYGDTILDFDVERVKTHAPGAPVVMTVIDKVDYGFMIVSPLFVSSLAQCGSLNYALWGVVKVPVENPFYEINTPESLAAFRERFA